IEEWLEEFSEKQLSQKGQYAWLKNRSLADLITQLTVDHELRYLPLVQLLARQWQAPAADMMISLTPKNGEDESTDSAG
ncbi:MAG: hypothetical protein R3D55_11800, partial [Chloroflexota bacterium]